MEEDVNKWDNVTKTHLTIEAKNYSDFRKKYDEVIKAHNYEDYRNKKTIKNYRKTDVSDALPGDSLSKYSENGKLTSEREALHQQIIDNFFEGKSPVDGQATFTVMGGGPASGKSTVVHQGVVKLPDGSIVIDSDAIKGMLPEYKTYVDMKYVKAVNGETVAGFVHEESSALAKRVMKIANGENFNYVLDGTGDGSIKSLTKKIEQARTAGFKVVGEYVTVPADVALERATARGINTGRIITPNIITGTHRKVSEILPECAHLFDDIKLYDTTRTGKIIW